MKSSPPSRSSSSRAASIAAPARSAPKRKSSPALAEPGASRRTQRKARNRRNAFVVWTTFAALSAVIAGTAFGVSSRHVRVKGIWGEYRSVKARVATKQATLKDLQAQLAHARKRLAAFEHGSGRERALAENGFVRPGERILLFPPDKDGER